MNKRFIRGFLLIALFAVLTLSLIFSASGARLLGDINGDGKITVFDAQLMLEQRLMVRELTIDQQENLGNATFEQIIGWVFEGVVAVPDIDPNSIAMVQNGDVTTYVTTVDDLLAAIDPTGNSKVTLMKDITNDGPINLPYSCYLDLDGHSITTNPTSSNGLWIRAAGSQNKTTTVYNGKINAYNLGIRVDAGAIEVRDMDVECTNGICLAIYETTNYADINRIYGSTMTSGGNGCIGFCGVELDFTNTGITVENSTLLTSHETNRVLTSTGGSTPGTVTFTYDVNMYSVKVNLATGGYKLAYAPADKISGFTKSSDVSVTVRGVTYTGMTHWTTGSSDTSIAHVTNGTTVTPVYSVNEMVAAVNSDGNTTIKLLQDLNTGAAIKLPYSCTIDFNGHTINTGTTSGNGIQIAAKGTKNSVTTLKNGKLTFYSTGLRLAAGGFVVENMHLDGIYGPCLSIFETDSAYKDINRISGSTLSAGTSYCIYFATADADYKNTTVTLENSSIISTSTKDRGIMNGQQLMGTYLFNKPSADYDNGIANIHFGENVHLYTYRDHPAANSYSRYSGNFPNLDTQNTSVTVNGVTYEGINHWSNTVPSTAKTTVLAVGNSSFFRLVEEFYGVSKAGDEEVIMANLYYPACRLDQHLDWYYNDTPGYRDFWITSSLGHFLHNDIQTLKGALEYGDWDVIITHQRLAPENVIGSIRQTTSDQTSREAKELFDILKQWEPDATIIWQQSWARDVGHASTPNLETQYATYDGMKEISDRVAAENNLIQILAGDAFQAARANPNIEADPTHSDHAHDGYSTGGQYLLGCLWYETIFQRSCIGNTWVTTEYELDADLMAEMQKVAHQVVADRYGEDFVK